MADRDLSRTVTTPPMPVSPGAPGDANKLRGAAADFVGGLGRKTLELRAALTAMRATETRGRAHEELRRKLHALGVGARMLHFDALARAIADGTQILDENETQTVAQPATIAALERLLDAIPELAWQREASTTMAAVSASPPPPPNVANVANVATAAEPPHGAPSQDRIAVAAPRPSLPPRALAPSVTPPPDVSSLADRTLLVVGSAKLSTALAQQLSPGFCEIEQTDDLSTALDFARALAPDLIVVDVDRVGGLELVEALAADAISGPVALVAASPIDRVDEPTKRERIASLGIAWIDRVDALSAACARALRDHIALVSEGDAAPPGLGELSLRQLTERLADEVRRALTGGLDESILDRRVALGVGAEVLGPIWSALARVQEVVRARTHGAIAFANDGRASPIALSSELDAAVSQRLDLASATSATSASELATRGGRRRTGDGARSDLEVSLEGRKILIVDDEASVVAFIGEVLGAAGAHVVTATDGLEALHLARAIGPDAIVSDVLMPRMDGLALARALRRDVALRDRPVVLVSWKEDLLSRLRGLRMESQAMLRKEADGATLLARIREVLRPRARIEARIAAGGLHGVGDGARAFPTEVRGRLDDLSTVSLLEIVARLRHGATVVVRDAVSLYEIELEEGAIRSLSRTSLGRDESDFARGAAALLGVLGVNGGRFLVRPASMPGTHPEIEGSLTEQLAPVLRRLRGACDAVSGAQTVGVASVTIEPHALASYLVATPPSVRALVQAIASGRSPRSMILAGEVAPAILEDVLADLASRGMITAVRGPEGEDLLARAEALIDKAPPSLVPKTPPPPRSVREPRAPSDASPAPVEPLPTDLESFVNRTLLAPTMPPRTPSSQPSADAGLDAAIATTLADAVLRQVTGGSDSVRSGSIVDPTTLKPRSSHESGRVVEVKAEIARDIDAPFTTTAALDGVATAPRSQSGRHRAVEPVADTIEGADRSSRSVTSGSGRPRSSTLQGIAPLDLDDVFSPAKVLPLDARAAQKAPPADADVAPTSQAEFFPPTAEIAAPIATQAATIANVTGTLPSGEAVEIVGVPAKVSAIARADEESVPSTQPTSLAPAIAPALAKTMTLAAQIAPEPAPKPKIAAEVASVEAFAKTMQAATMSPEVARAPVAATAPVRVATAPKGAPPATEPEGGLFGWVILFLLAIAAIVGGYFVQNRPNDLSAPIPTPSASAAKPR